MWGLCRVCMCGGGYSVCVFVRRDNDCQKNNVIKSLASFPGSGSGEREPGNEAIQSWPSQVSVINTPILEYKTILVS